jgi:hypothetical protein
MVSAIQLSGICELLELCVAGHLVDTRATAYPCTLRCFSALLQAEMSGARWTRLPCCMWGGLLSEAEELEILWLVWISTICAGVKGCRMAV